MSEQPKALELANRLATRQVRNYCSATGDPPRVSGFRPDRECAEAADLLRTQHAELEALRKEVERLREDAARYQFSREDPDLIGICQWDSGSHEWVIVTPDMCDEIVDAARGAKG